MNEPEKHTYKVHIYQEFIIDAENRKDAIEEARKKFRLDTNIGWYRSMCFEAETYLIK